MTNRAQEAMDFFQSKGWSPVQSAAIVGHGIGESGLDAGKHQNGGNAYGTFQWDDRKDKMLSWVRSKGYADNDFRGQLEFAQHELETSESFAADQLRAARDINSATAAFMHFERPKGYTRDNPTAGDNFAGRLAAAKEVFNGLANYPSTSTGYVPDGSVTAPPSPAKVSWDNPVQPRQPWSDTELNQAQAEALANSKPYSWGQAFTEDLRDGTTSWLLGKKTDLLPDPDWKPTPEVLKVAQNGLPEEYHAALGGAHSQAHLEYLHDQLAQEAERDGHLQAMGWLSRNSAGLASGLADPVTLLSALIPGGMPARASMLARVAARAATDGAVNAALAVPKVANDPSAHGSDLLWAAGTGAALGGAFGALAKNPAVSDEAAAMLRIGKSLQAHAEDEMVAGKPLLSLSGSVGAAKVSNRENLTVSADDWLHGAVDDAIAKAWAPKVRWDVAAMGKSSDNAATRAFTDNAVVDVVGNADKSMVSQVTAEEWQKQLDTDFGMKAEKAHVSGLSEFMQSRSLKAADREDAEHEFKRQVIDYLDNIRPETEFDPAVAKTGALQRKLYADYLEYLQNPGLLDGSTRRPVKGFENVSRENYRPNVADHEKIDALSVRFGDDTMRQALAKVFKDKSPDLSDELAARMAKGYWRSLREATAGMTSMDRALHGDDMEALQNALTDLGIEGKDFDTIVRAVTPKPTEGAAMARAKRRAIYDNNQTVRIKANDGTWQDFKMKDLFQDDYLYLFKNYSRQASGQIGMAMMRVKNPLYHAVENPTVPEHLIDGITSRGEFETFVRDMRSVWDGKAEVPKATRDAEANRDEGRLRFMYDRITGTPDKVQFPNLAKFMRAVHDYNYVRVMNQVGLAQFGEMLGVTTQMGLKAAIQGIPTFKAMLRDAATGELKDGFAREMEELSGFGADWFRDGFRHHKDDLGEMIDKSANGSRWNTVDDLLHKGKRFTNAVSGMSAVDSFSRRWASAAAVMKIVNAAAKTGDGEAVKGLNMGRMRALGLDDAMAKRVFSQIRKHADFENGEVGGRNYLSGNFGKWDDQEALSHFRTAIWRWSRMVIQEGHLGQSSVALSQPMARTILQFRNFMMASWTNNFLRQIHHMDGSTAAHFLMTSVVGGLVYAAQQSLNAVGRSDREDYLKDKLSPEGMAKAMIQRGEWSSIMPTIFDTGAFLLGSKPWFDNRASGTASSIFGSPSADLFSSSIGAVHGMTRAAREGDWSQGEIRRLQRVLPFQNVIGVQPLVNSLISGQPLRSPGASR